MASYRQFCGLARSLDVVGDRWTLLIVRELLVRPARYGELLAGLPGVATNLLADRLRRLDADGIVRRDGDRYELTERGAALEEVIGAYIRWSLPLMVTGPGGDAFRPHWLVPALGALLAGRRTRSGTIEVGADGSALHVRTGRTGPSVHHGAPPMPPAAVLTAPATVLLAAAAGAVRLEGAGVTVTGDRALVESLFSGSGQL